MRKATGAGQRHTEHGVLQKQRLVDAAYDIIAELGFEGLHTRNVAARVGMNDRGAELRGIVRTARKLIV